MIKSWPRLQMIIIFVPSFSDSEKVLHMSKFYTHQHIYEVKKEQLAPSGILQNGYYNVIANVGRFIQIADLKLDYDTTKKFGYEINSLEYLTRYFTPIIGLKKIYLYSRVSLHKERKTCLFFESVFTPNKILDFQRQFEDFENKHCQIWGTAVILKSETRKPIRIPSTIKDIFISST